MTKNNMYKVQKKPEILTIEASAGTGKTRALALRYLQILMTEEPSRILAVTYTNKAANEMKERIISYLKERALLKDKVKTNELKEFFPEKCKEKIEKILYNYNEFRVHTIDSFVSLLGKALSFNFSLSPDVDFTFDEESIIESSLKLLLEESKKDKIKYNEFKNFYENYYNIEKKSSWNIFDTFFKSFKNLIYLENKKGKEILLPTKPVNLKRYSKDLEKYTYELLRTVYFPSNILFKEFKYCLKKVLENESFITLPHLYKLLLETLKEEGVVPEVMEKFGEEILHYLIDEFQDTSPVQWKIYYPMIENALSKGGTLFYVGDRKQAIYAYRGGDWRIFEEAKNYASVENPRIEELNLNFRCKENILNYVKNFFSEDNLFKIVNKEIVDFNVIKKHFEPVQKSISNEKDGYVYIDLIPEKKVLKAEAEQDCLKKLIDLLKEKILKNYDPSDIAILVRKNDEAMMVLRALLEEKIPAISPTALGLLSCQRIKEITKILEFLNNTEDKLCFVSFLLSDIFCKKVNKEKKFWLDFFQENIKNDIFNEFSKSFPNYDKEYIKKLIEFSKILSPYELVIKIYHILDVLKNFQEEEAFFYSFLDWISKLQENGILSLNDLIKKIKDLEEENQAKVLMPQDLKQIQILTIHKAKGLGFPVVILPFFELMYLKDIEVIKDKNGKIIPFKSSKEKISKNKELLEIYKKEYTKELIDELNVLYVGMTRAKEALFLLFLNFSRNILTNLEISKKEIGEMKKKEVKKLEKIEKKLEFNYSDWAQKLSEEKGDINIYFIPNRYKSIKRGIELHKEIQNGKKEFIPENFQKLIFPEKFKSKEFEKEIVDRQGNLYRADLVIEFENFVNVIDFKFVEKKRDEHIEQIKIYANLLRKIYEKDVNKYILYFNDMEILKL